MCVVLVCEKVRPDEEFVEKAWERNSDGGGVAWREGDGDNKVVRWAKGLTKSEMQEFIKTMPLPFIAHFRIASTGSKSDELCHPFEVDVEPSLELEGATKGDVLFHNGTWTTWRHDTFKAASGFGIRLPRGEMNDTRSMAFIAALMGDNALEMINEKVVLFGPDRLHLFGTGWGDEKGILCSNKLFLNVSTFRGSTSGGVSGQGQVVSGGVSGTRVGTNNEPIEILIGKTEKAGGPSLLDLPFRGHLPAFSQWQAWAKRQADNQEPVQEGAGTVQAVTAEGESTGAAAEEERKTTVMGPTQWVSELNPKKYRTRSVIHDGIKFLGLAGDAS